MKKLSNKLIHPLRGLCLCLRKDRGVQFQLLFLVITLPILLYLFRPLLPLEVALLLLGYGLLFITELQNSALEKALDHLHPELHQNIRDSKDIAASSVLLSLVVFVSLVAILWLEQTPLL